MKQAKGGAIELSSPTAAASAGCPTHTFSDMCTVIRQAQLPCTERILLYARAGVSTLGFVATATEETPVVFRKGDVHTVVAQMLSQRAGRGLPSGHLAVTWQRSRWTAFFSVRSIFAVLLLHLC